MVKPIQDVKPREGNTHPPAPSDGAGDVEPRRAEPRTAPAQELVSAPKGHRPWVVLAAVLLVVVIAAAGASLLVWGGGRQSTSDAYVEGRIIRVSPKVPGQVIALHVDDNDPVEAGEVLLEIDPADYQAKVDQAEAAVVAAESGVEQAGAAVLAPKRASARPRRRRGRRKRSPNAAPRTTAGTRRWARTASRSSRWRRPSTPPTPPTTSARRRTGNPPPPGRN